ncbi:hypothetical protein ALSL_1759 [Aerosticca soli]|uniref:Uncharacterized protein n=1 Tax=Aerosticca soli TaxID=2010829 RepID=A0A2Z6E7C1_9GAMM|nr:hypothetical protein ALSL_1759 [Aerosticca soli]
MAMRASAACAAAFDAVIGIYPGQRIDGGSFVPGALPGQGSHGIGRP